MPAREQEAPPQGSEAGLKSPTALGGRANRGDAPLGLGVQ
jgi:hypothetical protein